MRLTHYRSVLFTYLQRRSIRSGWGSV